MLSLLDDDGAGAQLLGCAECEDAIVSEQVEVRLVVAADVQGHLDVGALKLGGRFQVVVGCTAQDDAVAGGQLREVRMPRLIAEHDRVVVDGLRCCELRVQVAIL